MQHQIKGTVLQVLEIELDPGESVLSEAGEFSWMTDSVQMTTGMGGGAGGKGLLGAVKRMAGGGTFLFNTYTAEGAPGMVAFAAKVPGTIFPIELNQEYLAHRHGFLAGTPGVEISVALQQTFRGGIFGGEGFLLQRIGGSRAGLDRAVGRGHDLRPAARARRCGSTRATSGSSSRRSPSR